jgi:hypothetical protein
MYIDRLSLIGCGVEVKSWYFKGVLLLRGMAQIDTMRL